jgi:copper chaperone CopZ
MSRVISLSVAAALVFCAAQAGAGDVVVKGPHICCKQCKNIAEKLLSKVDGVTDAAADQASKTVKFKAKDDAAAMAGYKALVDGGFFGTATNDGKELKIVVPTASGKSDAVTVKDVHVCCGACKKAINGLFTDAKVAYEGKGPQVSVIVTGSSLDAGAVLDTLRKKGFNGTVQK